MNFREMFALSVIAGLFISFPSSSRAYMTEPREFRKDDFDFTDANDRKWATVIIKGVNKVARENSECAQINPTSAGFGGENEVREKNPTFYVGCANAQGKRFNVFFTARDVGSDVRIATVNPISEKSALAACQKAITSLAISSDGHVQIPTKWDAHFQTWPGGRARLESQFEAKGPLGLVRTFVGRCFFDGQKIGDVEFSEFPH